MFKSFIILISVFALLLAPSTIYAGESCYEGDTTEQQPCTVDNCQGRQIRSCIIGTGKQVGMWGSWSKCNYLICPNKIATCSDYKDKGTSRSCYVPGGIGVAPAGNICPDNHWTTCAQGYICSKTNSGPGNVGACISTAKSTSSSTAGAGGGSTTTSSTPSPICKTTTSCSNTGCIATKDCRSRGGKVTSYCNTIQTRGGCEICKTTTVCTTPSPVPSPSPSPVPSEAPVALCHNVIIYGKDFKSLDTDELANFKAGDQLYFCALGAGNAGSFTKARFTINGIVRAEVTYQKPESQYYCDLYTIPANTYDFAASAEVYNTVLGWR